MKTQEKYYLFDISLKYSKFGFNSSMISSMLENIVYLELKRREYDVYIGKNTDKEIDFIVIRKNEKIYVQVCCELPSNSNRKIDNLLQIKEHYHKYVVIKDKLAKGNINGVELINIVNFLLKEEY